MKTAVDPEAARELAPKGVLRAGVNLSNPLLVTGRTEAGDPVGVSPDMAPPSPRNGEKLCRGVCTPSASGRLSG